jgi:hypothetical protein
MGVPNMANRLYLPRRYAQVGMIGAVLFLLALPARVRAMNNCPWMNEATASELVGGDATGAYLPAKDKPAVCTFTEHFGKDTRTLTISVATVTDPHGSFLTTLHSDCPSAAAPLSAIGNEAATCIIDRGKSVIGEKALGRVRDQIFAITISTTMKNDPALTDVLLKMKIGTAAEQVAGNLF